MLSHRDHKLTSDHQALISTYRMAYALSSQYSTIDFLERSNCTLKKEKCLLKESNQLLSRDKATLLEQVAALKARLAVLNDQHFGASSEAQQSLEPTTPTDPPEDEPATDEENSTVLVKAHQRKRGGKTKGRRIDTTQLPRLRIEHELSEEKSCCPECQQKLVRAGERITEQIACIPQWVYVEEHVSGKYVCRACNVIQMASKPLAPIPKALASESLLTETIINKYHHALPLYRQSKILKSYGIDIPDNTLANWVMTVGDSLLLLEPVLWRALLSSRYLQVDETPIKLLSQKSKGYVWCYLAPPTRLVIFEVATSRSSTVVQQRLASFEGLLQTDGYSGYTKLRRQAGITGLSCLTHARRKFAELIKAKQDKSGVAATVVEKMEPLYALEAELRAQPTRPHRWRKRRRRQEARPRLKKLQRYLEKVKARVPPKSGLGKAISYALNQWPYIMAYTQHGLAEIDTNPVENQIRPIALGRKNFLFIANEISGRKSALYFSLIQSCVLNEINPRLYMHYLLTQLHDIRRGTVDLERLLPHKIDRSVLEQFGAQQLRHMQAILPRLKYPETAEEAAAATS